MTRFYFHIFFLIFSCSTWAQIEFSPKFKPIKPIKVTPKKEPETPPKITSFEKPKIVAPNIFKETNIFGTKPKPNNSFAIGVPENTFSMTKKDVFQHKLGDIFQDKMAKDLSKSLVREGLKEDDRYLVKIDLKFGEIRTKSEYFVIKFRDFVEIDGDLVKAIFNGYVIQKRLELKYEYQEFKIFFVNGINTLDIEALNRGSSGGNTGEFQFFDAEGKLITSDYWMGFDTGVKAKFIIIKE